MGPHGFESFKWDLYGFIGVSCNSWLAVVTHFQPLPSSILAKCPSAKVKYFFNHENIIRDGGSTSFGCNNSWKRTSLSENEHIPDYCFSYQVLCPNTQSYNYNVFFSIIYLISYIYWYCTYFCLKILHIPYKCFYNHNLCPHDPIILLHGRLTQKGNKNQASDCFGSKHKIWCTCSNCWCWKIM